LVSLFFLWGLGRRCKIAELECFLLYYLVTVT